MQLEARHVEVREAVVLLLDLHEARGELPVLLLERLQPIERVLVLAFQALDAFHELLAQPVPLLGVLGSVLLSRFQLVKAATQAGVLFHELTRELGTAPEQREKLAGAFEDLAIPLTHAPSPFRSSGFPAKPDRIIPAMA